MEIAKHCDQCVLPIKLVRHRLPHRYIRPDSDPVCIGQKQKWFLLKLTAPAGNIQLNLSDPAEFDEWQWVSYWYPLGQVVNFKRDVYRRAMMELCMLLPQQQSAEKSLL